jgi:hypothetical protein
VGRRLGQHGKPDHRTGGGATARAGHAVIALIILVAFVTQVVLIFTGGADANSGTSGESLSDGVRLVRLLSYFTIESNLIVLAAEATLAFRPDWDGRRWRTLRLDSLLGIIITGLVYDIVLAGQVHLTGTALVLTIAFHYVSPWATLLGWLLFGPRPRIAWSTVGWAFVWPIAWIAYTFVHGHSSGWYPYPFLDAHTKGYVTALINTGVVLVIGLVLAVILKAIDRLRTVG